MLIVLFTMLLLQLLSIVAVVAGPVSYDIVVLLAATWLAFLYGKRKGKQS